jgi:hypothetical protein
MLGLIMAEKKFLLKGLRILERCVMIINLSAGVAQW